MSDTDVAIVGLAGRFPGAGSVDELWQTLRDGRVAIDRWEPPPDQDLVGAEGVLAEIDTFDTDLFGIAPGEAAITDPQHRQLLSCSWEALEQAGRRPGAASRPTGVFVSTGLSTYLVRNLLASEDVVELFGGFNLVVHNDKDFAASAISHRLGLTGPSLSVGTACSSSLVAVHLAVQSLLAGECDAALAGGASIIVPTRQGYRWAPGAIYSATGTCRPYDADADGTVGGSGAGVVVLARLDDAVAAGDHIWAVIKGSAVNNDGGDKQSFAAPSVRGHVAVAREALAVAGVDPATVDLVEGHGTGTPLGDPVEVAALAEAYRRSGSDGPRCGLSSIKANLGHLDAAAGVTALIKATLAVHHGVIPGTPTFREPNPLLDLASTPFRIDAEARRWPEGRLRRAGVSSLGAGGTNAHVILEEPPPTPGPSPAQVERPRVLAISARTDDEVDELAMRLADELEGRPDLDLADVEHTLLVGRTPFTTRRTIVASSTAEAVSALRTSRETETVAQERPIVFAFPGHGAQYPGMAAALVRTLPAVSAAIDQCVEVIERAGGVALATSVRRALTDPDFPAADLVEPVLAQPTMFAFEWALAMGLRSHGVHPAAVVGHSLGDLVAAAASDVFDLADAVALAVERGRLLAEAPVGTMTALACDEADAVSLLPPGASIAAVNAARQCVASGDEQAIAEVEARADAAGIASHRLAVTRAYHHPSLAGHVARLRSLVAASTRRPPSVRYLSTERGTWVSGDDAGDPDRWAAQVHRPVQFAAACREVAALGRPLVVEVGPGRALAGCFAATVPEADLVTVSVLGREAHPGGEASSWVRSIAEIWAHGGAMDAPAAAADGRLVPLPVAPLRRDRHWIDVPGASTPAGPDLDAVFAAAAAESSARSIDERPGVRRHLERLCEAIAGEQVVAVLGADRVPEPALVDRLGTLPGFLGLRTLLVDLAQRGGFVAGAGGELECTGLRPSVEGAASALVAADGSLQWLAELLMHCADRYPTALSVPGEALATLYPDGEGSLLERFLADAATTSHLDEAMNVVEAIVEEERRRVGRPLRVLEVGAGSGTLTFRLAGGQRWNDIDEYWATDVGEAFVEHLARRAEVEGVDRLRTARVDMALDRPGDLPGGGDFDLVLALDAVHAVPDVVRTLERLAARVRVDGRLVLVESTGVADVWLSLVWGLSEHWWARSDDRDRAPTPLLSGPAWVDATSAAGWQQARAVPRSDDRGIAVVTARRGPATAPRSPIDVLPTERRPQDRWLYVPSWHRTSLLVDAGPASVDEERDHITLAFVADDASRALARAIAPPGELVLVSPGREWQPLGHDEHEVAPGSSEDLVQLLAERSAGRVPDVVLHLWSVVADDGDRSSREAPATIERGRQDAGLHTALAYARAAGTHAPGAAYRTIVVTRGACAVLGDDVDRPDRATLLAAAKIIPREYREVSCVVVDLARDEELDPPRTWVVEQLRREVAATGGEPSVAYRGRSRWLPGVAPRPAPTPTTPSQGSTYLVAGGLGGIGSALAQHLATRPARVIVTSRSPFPPREHWPDIVSAGDEADPHLIPIRRMLAAEERGGSIEVHRADLTDLEEMAALLSRVGPVAGVVHAAGVVDAAGTIQRRTPDDTWRATASKVAGATVLDRLLPDPLEFFVLCSSIGATLYKLKFGEVGYVAGNEYVEAFAHARRARCGDATAVEWTDWQEAGMWARAQTRLTGTYDPGSATGATFLSRDLLLGLTDGEGAAVFDRVLAVDDPVVVVSTVDLLAFLAVHERFTTDDHADVLDQVELRHTGRDVRRATNHQAPVGAVEEIVASLWTALLQVPDVGRADDFFALGGDSLLGLRFLARVRDELGIDYPMARLFACSELATVAADLDAIRMGAGDLVDDVEEVLL